MTHLDINRRTLERHTDYRAQVMNNVIHMLTGELMNNRPDAPSHAQEYAEDALEYSAAERQVIIARIQALAGSLAISCRRLHDIESEWGCFSSLCDWDGAEFGAILEDIAGQDFGPLTDER